MRVILISTAVASLLGSAPLSARERLFAPTDDWHAESTGESCLTTRNFRDSRSEAIRLQIQSYKPGMTLKISMVGDGLPLRDGTRGITVVKYRFKPDPSWREGGGATGFLGGVNSLTFYADLFTLDQTEKWARGLEPYSVADGIRYSRSRAAEVDQLALAFRSRDDIVLQLGSLTEPYGGLEACVHELPRGWGYDPALMDALRSEPKLVNAPEIGTILLDTLQDAKLRFADAIHYRLDVDERGNIANCIVQYPKRADATEVTICGILRSRAHFEPALDVNGAPIRAPFVSRIVFGIR